MIARFSLIPPAGNRAALVQLNNPDVLLILKKSVAAGNLRLRDISEQQPAVTIVHAHVSRYGDGPDEKVGWTGADSKIGPGILGVVESAITNIKRRGVPGIRPAQYHRPVVTRVRRTAACSGFKWLAIVIKE